DKNSDLTILGFDFAEGEREMSKIVLTAPKSASVGISTIRIFPDVENKFIATPGFAGKLEYSAEGVYSLPLPEEGTFHRPELLKTAIFDNTGSIVSCTCRYSDNNQFTLSAGEDFAPIQEGLYGICYYYDDGDYKPVAEDGLRFSITPSIAGLSLNLIKIDSENSFVEIPYNKEMPGMTYSATKAVISGEKDGTIIYWKVDRQGSKFYVEDDGAINISESEQESALPEGYSVYDDRGINLTQGNRLSLILERNGARSNPYEISYFITDVPTGVNLAEDESSVETFQFFTIAGTILDADKLDNFQGIYLEKITSANGEIKVIKHIK
ncbi:MAG: hypothetical protein K2H35_08290, partial [Muribaculaceae bacterium]|nr:hypothetical protein [Muribaculaceae bacterium]